MSQYEHMKAPTKVRYWHDVNMRTRTVTESIEILTDHGHSYRPERFLCRPGSTWTKTPPSGMVTYTIRNPMTEMPIYRVYDLDQARQLRDSLNEALS